MKWLLDTNILSELRRPQPEPRVTSFVADRPQAAAIPLIGAPTVEDFEISYAQLENQESRPDPYQLQIWSQRLSDAYKNMSVCQQAITNGWQSLLTDDQEHQRVVDAQYHLAQIDQEFKFAPRK